MASNASNHGGAATTIIAVHPDHILETHILSKLDGQSLASVASTSQLLYAATSKEYLWENLCNSTWNSVNHLFVRQVISTFPDGYRSFFSDSFPILRPNSQGPRLHRQPDQVRTSELISAVDICYEGEPVYSKVIVTNTHNERFLGSTFLINLLHGNESVQMPLTFQGDEDKCMLCLEENMTFSWILIDPTQKRAANVSSLRPVSVEPHWDGDGCHIEVTYSTVISGDGNTPEEFAECKIVAIFSCTEGKDLEMTEVTFYVEDMYKGVLNGEKSLRILEEAMVSGERKKRNGVEETKEKYVKYLEMKRGRRVEMKRKEKRLDMVYRITWVIHILTWVLFAICLRYAFM